MTHYIITLYRAQLVRTLPMAKFPLVHAMCDKNDYEHIAGENVLVMLQVRYGKLMSVVIYQETDEGSVKVYCVEVTSDCRLLDFGTKAINELKRTYDIITLNSLPDSKIFYEKLGFEATGDNTYTWRHNDS